MEIGVLTPTFGTAACASELAVGSCPTCFYCFCEAGYADKKGTDRGRLQPCRILRGCQNLHNKLSIMCFQRFGLLAKVKASLRDIQDFSEVKRACSHVLAINVKPDTSLGVIPIKCINPEIVRPAKYCMLILTLAKSGGSYQG